MQIDFVKYDRRFFLMSGIWLMDPEIKKLTMTPDLDEEKRRQWFDNLDGRENYYIRGIEADSKPIGAVGIKHIDFDHHVGEYWGYIGEKSYIGLGIGKKMVAQMINIAHEYGLKSLLLNVAAFNTKAIGLYKSTGFVQINVSKEIILMERPIV